jgi:integrase
MAEGVLYRHSRECQKNKAQAQCGNRCNPSLTPWEAWVYSKRDKKKIRSSAHGERFATQAAAKSWRIDALKAVKDRRLRTPSSKTIRQEVDEWLAGARDGRILNRQKQVYKPSVVRLYERSLRRRVLPELGDRRLADVDHRDLLELKEQMLGEGCSASTIRAALVPVQSVYRRAVRNGSVSVNPALDLELPTPKARERAATPEQATRLIEVLGERLGAIWAAAFYTGLRRGELQALRADSVDVAAGAIEVKCGWDPIEGEIAVKSAAGRRQVFLCDTLRPYLEPLVERRDPRAFVFGTDVSPFDARAALRRAQSAVAKAGDAFPDEDWFTVHEARHSFSTWMDHSGISETRADRYMGHAPRGVAGRYRHQLAGQLAEDARRFDDYLVGAAAGKIVEIGRAASAG